MLLVLVWVVWVNRAFYSTLVLVIVCVLSKARVCEMFFLLFFFTSEVNPQMASQSNRGNMLIRKSTFNSISTLSNSASRGCRGNAVVSCLHDLRAQVRKFRVRSFIFFAGNRRAS
jgi:hypothetical protein